MNEAVSRRHISVQLNGHELFLNPDDRAITDCLIDTAAWEPVETEVVRKEVKRGFVVVDIGANIGYYTLLFAMIVGDRGHVFAFEPDPTNFAFLRTNVERNGYDNVTLIQKAVSDENRWVQLYLDDYNKGDHRVYDSGDGRQFIWVESMRLDDYLKNYDRRIDFIKMDIQGAEWRAVQGMTDILEKNQSIKVVTEFWPAGLNSAGIDPEEYLKLLANHGFKLHEMDEEEASVGPTNAAELLRDYTPENERFTNLFCTRAEWKWDRPLNRSGSRLRLAQAELAALIPAGDAFILIDEEQFGGEVPPGRHAIPFLERDGQYWGPPPDDATAIEELERLRQAGAHFIVFARPAFWWLEYYTGFHCHLRAQFPCLLENYRLIVFDLRP
jgi:FkbM family methyltransferase